MPSRETARRGEGPGSGLLRELRQRVERARRELGEESALPAPVFECQEPMVEAALYGLARELLLGHMPAGAPRQRDIERLPPQPVDAARAEACHEIVEQLDAEAPDCGDGLAAEQLAVLLELAARGFGDIRMRAARAAQRALADMDDGDEHIAAALLRAGEGGSQLLHAVLEQHIAAAEVEERGA